MKKRNKILTSITLIFIMLFSYMVPLVPVLPVYAANEWSHDFKDIASLPSETSYGTLFWTESTEIQELPGNTATKIGENLAHLYDESGWTGYTIDKDGTDERLLIKITNCAVDKDGDMCDVICELSNLEKFVNYEPASDHEFWIGKHPAFPSGYYDYSESTFSSEEQEEVKNAKQNSNLIEMWFEIRQASIHFNMKYVKAGTETPANITKAASTLFDIDIQFEDSNKKWNGNEGFTTDGATGEIYYNKETGETGGWLTDTEDGIGARIKDKSDWVKNVYYLPENYMNKVDSAVLVEDLTDATYKLFYSGQGCGIGWVFASPYSFDLEEPVKSLDKTTVFEGETFNYTVKQYVPGNYYADVVDFITTRGGKYSSFKIEDELDSNLEIAGEITIANELRKDVTKEFFDITTDDNKVTATAKSDIIGKEDFYNHFYNINIPVKVKSGTGINTATIPNTSTTTAITTLGTETKTSNEVNTALKYNVDINATIDNGTTKINDGEEHQITGYQTTVNRGDDSNNTVNFTVAEGYKVASITIDSENSPLTDWTLADGTYSYEFQDNDINQNIEHNVIIVTEKKDSQVIVKYVDEEGNEISGSVTLPGKVGESYTTTAKDIPGYELKTTPDNATGDFKEEPITVTYVYMKKDTSVIVRYIDAKTNKELTDAVTIPGKVGDQYTTVEKTFENYRLTATPTNATGTMTEDQIEVDYYYISEDTVVLVNYIDEDGNQLTNSITIPGKIGDQYTTDRKEFNGYELKSVPTNATGTMTEETIVVDYIYKAKPAKVIVKYVDKDGKEIVDGTVIEGKYFETYNTSSKEITNYNLVKVPTNASGTMNQDETVVTYIYDLKPAQVIVNYLDKNGKKIADTETITGKVTDNYEAKAKEIKEYKVSKTPSNAKGKMTENTIVVNYIYEKTTAEKILPDTGNFEKTIIIFSSIAILAVFGTIMGLKVKKYRGI